MRPGSIIQHSNRLLLGILLLFSAGAMAQTGRTGAIKGKVTTADGQVADGVSILIEGTSRGTVSNSKGLYELKRLSAGDYVLVASFTGLQTQQVHVTVTDGATAQADITLTESSATMQEVVVSSQKSNYKEDEISSSLRIQTSLMETPQSIVIINNDLIKDQQLFTTTDITKNVSGVTSIYPYVNIYTDFNIRGTRAQSNKLRNGMPIAANYGTL